MSIGCPTIAWSVAGNAFRRKVRRSAKGYRVCGDEVWVDPQADVRLFGYPYRWDNPEWREFSLMRGSGEDVFSVERRIGFGAALLSWRGEGASPGVADGDNVAGHRAAEFIAGIGAVAGADDSLAAAAWSVAHRAVRCGGDVPASGALGLAAVGFGGLHRIKAGAVVRRPFCYFECFMAQNAVLGAVIGRNHDCLSGSRR